MVAPCVRMSNGRTRGNMIAYRMRTGKMLRTGEMLDAMLIFQGCASPPNTVNRDGEIKVSTGISPVITVVPAHRYGVLVHDCEGGEDDVQ